MAEPIVTAPRSIVRRRTSKTCVAISHRNDRDHHGGEEQRWVRQGLRAGALRDATTVAMINE
jgi:hypothetical protein